MGILVNNVDNLTGAPNSDLFIFSTPSWQRHSNSSLKMASCSLGTRYDFMRYSLASSCSYISTGLVFQVPSVPLKSNSNFLNTICSIDWSSSVECLLSDASLQNLASKMWCVCRVAYSTCLLSHNYFFQQVFLLSQFDDESELIFEKDFIGDIHPLYAPQFPLIELSEIRTLIWLLLLIFV